MKIKVGLIVVLLFNIGISNAVVADDNINLSKSNYNLGSEQEKNINHYSQIGWKKNNNGLYILKDGKGNTVKNSWCKVGQKWYYFNEDGTMKIGWLLKDGKWYYLGNDGSQKLGWVDTHGSWYYFDANGSMHKGWLDYRGYWFYLDSRGEMVKGWKKIDGFWYYFNNSGIMQYNRIVDGYKLNWHGICEK